MSEEKPRGLAAAVCQVMQKVRYVQKSGRNDFHRYTYASDADLLEALQPAMAEAGLAMVPGEVRVTTSEHSPDRKGKPQWRTDLVVTYTLLHTSGEKIQIEAPGCGIDGEDKGVYKAMTGALKYALRHTFMVPTGDDAERDHAPRAAQTWTPEQQASFFQALSELDYLTNYHHLCAFLIENGRPTPDIMDASQRSALLRWLEAADSTSGKLTDYIAARIS